MRVGPLLPEGDHSTQTLSWYLFAHTRTAGTISVCRGHLSLARTRTRLA